LCRPVEKHEVAPAAGRRFPLKSMRICNNSRFEERGNTRYLRFYSLSAVKRAIRLPKVQRNRSKFCARELKRELKSGAEISRGVSCGGSSISVLALNNILHIIARRSNNSVFSIRHGDIARYRRLHRRSSVSRRVLHPLRGTSRDFATSSVSGQEDARAASSRIHLIHNRTKTARMMHSRARYAARILSVLSSGAGRHVFRARKPVAPTSRRDRKLIACDVVTDEGRPRVGA